MTKCHCCEGPEFRFTFKTSVGRVALCNACFQQLPQKVTWQATLRSYARKVKS